MPQGGVPYAPYLGHIYKYCPYSTNHKNKYYNNGFHGNTNNAEILATTDLSTIPTADHLYTDGTMVMWSRPGAPGWLCLDDDCPYFISNAKRYFET